MKRLRLWPSHLLHLVLLLGCILLAAKPDEALAQQQYESYFLFNGAYPDEEETSYSGECQNNMQGITHDDDNWYISQTYDLWKIPVEYDLRHVDHTSQFPEVVRVRLYDMELPDGTSLVNLGYYHIGDLSYYRGYVIAPIEANSPQPHGIFLFRADDLQCMGYATISGYRDLGWVAVDSAGFLYTSRDSSTYLEQWEVNWDDFPGHSLELQLTQQIHLQCEDGSPFDCGHAQGAVFSPSGDLFYFLIGIFDADDTNEGINVFDTGSSGADVWRRIQWSKDSSYFSYEFSHTCEFPVYICEEPEGITIWDLDDGRAPGIRGQLHAVVLDNDASCEVPIWNDVNEPLYDDDDVYLYHYINTIYVNLSYSGEETGEPHKPFNTVGEANHFAWNGARIKIQTGSYSEALTFSKRIQILAKDGTARVGSGGQIALTTSGAINLYSGGALRLSAP